MSTPFTASRPAKFRAVAAAVVVGLALAATACAPPPAPTSTVDQSWAPLNPAGTNPDTCDGTTFLRAQTFTAGRTGSLDKVSLAVAGTGSPVLQLQIRNTVGGVPGTAVLGFGTYSGPYSTATVDGAGAPIFTDMALSSPAPVIAGTQYALVFTLAPGCTGSLASSFSLFTPFPGGAGYSTSVGDPTTFSPLFGTAAANANLVFRTWVL